MICPVVVAGPVTQKKSDHVCTISSAVVILLPSGIFDSILSTSLSDSAEIQSTWHIMACNIPQQKPRLLLIPYFNNSTAIPLSLHLRPPFDAA
jgi:hypothetical protein